MDRRADHQDDAEARARHRIREENGHWLNVATQIEHLATRVVRGRCWLWGSPVPVHRPEPPGCAEREVTTRACEKLAAILDRLATRTVGDSDIRPTGCRYPKRKRILSSGWQAAT